LEKQKLAIHHIEEQGHKIVAWLDLGEQEMKVTLDDAGVPLFQPPEREVLPPDCARCSLVPVCRRLPPGSGVAFLWRKLGLIDEKGVPTVRGRITSFFSGADGLAIAAAVEEGAYALDEMIYDFANLDAGFRFCGEENRWGGRLAQACQRAYGSFNASGYLENGLPLKYGAGAEQVVASVHKNPLTKHQWATDFLGVGDIDRIIIEWRSLLRQLAHAPDLPMKRWLELKQLARTTLNETESPTLRELPPLEYLQTNRIEHRLVLRR
jgi:hypothetical protein